jgi:hypothetical protein
MRTEEFQQNTYSFVDMLWSLSGDRDMLGAEGLTVDLRVEEAVSRRRRTARGWVVEGFWVFTETLPTFDVVGNFSNTTFEGAWELSLRGEFIEGCGKGVT